MLVLDCSLVIIQRVDTESNVETFSLDTFQSLWSRTDVAELLLIPDLMRGPDRDVKTFNNYFAFFRPNIVTLFEVTEATLKTMEISLPARRMFQYPKFWAFSEDYLSLPHQEIPVLMAGDRGPNPPQVLCWSLKEGRRFNLETDINVDCTSSVFDATEILDEECFGFSNRSLFSWNIKTETLTRKIIFNTAFPFKSLSVKHGFCIFATGIFDVRGHQLATFPREAVGPIKVYNIFNKRLIVFGRKRFRVADLSDLSVDNVRELSFRVLDISPPLGATDQTIVGETYLSKEMFCPTVYSFL